MNDLKEFNLRLEVETTVRATSFHAAAAALETAAGDMSLEDADTGSTVKKIEIKKIHVAKKKPRKSGYVDIPVPDARAKGDKKQ